MEPCGLHAGFEVSQSPQAKDINKSPGAAAAAAAAAATATERGSNLPPPIMATLVFPDQYVMCAAVESDEEETVFAFGSAWETK